MHKTLKIYSRSERYRFAGRTLKYKVYVTLEVLFAIASFAAVFTAALADNDVLLWTLSVTALALSLLHHLSQILMRPHILLTCFFWSLVFYLVYDVWLSSEFALPQAGPLLLIFIGLCYLIRGEGLVNTDAFSSISSINSSNQ